MTWRDYVPSIDLRKNCEAAGAPESDSRRSRRSSSFTGSPSSQRSQPDRSLSPRSRRSCCSSCSARRPAERIDTFVSDLLSGEAGVQWYEWLLDQWAALRRRLPDDPLTARYYSIVTTGSVEMLFSDIFKTETAGRSRLRIAWYSRKNRSQPNSISWYVHIYLWLIHPSFKSRNS